MNTHKASLLNSFILFFLGLWGYIAVNQDNLLSPEHFTPLIPVIVGILLFILNKGLKNQNKVSSHLVVLLTFFILGGLFMPLKDGIENQNTMKIFRACVMIASTIFAFYYQIQSFVNARIKNK